MDETFYGVLGVDADADDEHIRSAYRERVKENHPDVSDDPDAPEQFKRLITARDVLLDEKEREKYDRMGHATYVRRHVENSSWSKPPHGRPGTKSRRTPRGSGRRTAQTSPDRTAWLGEDWEPDDSTTTRMNGRGESDGHATYGGKPWQQASDAYRRAETTTDRRGSKFASFADGMRQVGGWVVVDLVFILSALATAGFVLTDASGHGGASASALVGTVLVLTVVVSLSALHLVSQLYT